MRKKDENSKSKDNHARSTVKGARSSCGKMILAGAVRRLKWGVKNTRRIKPEPDGSQQKKKGEGKKVAGRAKYPLQATGGHGQNQILSRGRRESVTATLGKASVAEERKGADVRNGNKGRGGHRGRKKGDTNDRKGKKTRRAAV